MKILPLYEVVADRATGEWIGDPSLIGEIEDKVHLSKKDTEDIHYDTYEHFEKYSVDSETRAIIVHFIND